MNIILLEPDEVGSRIPRGDRRWKHVREILKKSPGSTLDAGIVEGPLGVATVRELDERGMVLDFSAEGPPEPFAPLRLVLGFPRPIQAARILRDLATLGVERIDLTGTELGEKSYTQSDFFKNREFRRPLIEGAEQAGTTRLPLVRTHWTLARCLDALTETEVGGLVNGGTQVKATEGSRIALHPYAEAPNFGALPTPTTPVTIAIGSERGWTDAEVALLARAGFFPARLGNRILKTETASLAATAIALSKLGLA